MKIKIIIIGLITITFILFVSTGYSLLKKNLSIEGKGRLVRKVQTKYELTITDKDWYNNNKFYYNPTIRLTNNTSEKTSNFKITLPKPVNIEELVCWNIECSIVENNLIVSSRTISIEPKSYIEFSFMFNTSESYNFKDYDLEINFKEENTTEKDDLNITIIFGNSWMQEEYYIYQYTVAFTNETNSSIKGWELAFDLGDNTELVSTWNNISKVEKNTLILANEVYNGQLKIGDKIEFGIQLKSTEKNYQLKALYAKGFK